MRAAARVSEEQLAEILPQPLLDNYRLSEGYSRLVELARSFPEDPSGVLKGALRKTKARPRRVIHPLVKKTLNLLADALRQPDQEEAELCHYFEVILELFQTMPNRDRKRLLSVIQKIADAYQRQV